MLQEMEPAIQVANAETEVAPQVEIVQQGKLLKSVILQKRAPF